MNTFYFRFRLKDINKTGIATVYDDANIIEEIECNYGH